MNKGILFFVLLILGSLMSINSQTAADYSILYSRIYSNNFRSVSSYPLSNQKADGSFVNATEIRDHLDEMLKIAKTYQTAGANFHSEDLFNAYVKAWNWWLKTNPTNSNWWWRSIGWPKSLYPSFVVIGKELKAKSPTDYASLLKYLMAEWTPANIKSYSLDPSGANTTDVCNYIMAASIVDENATIINQVAKIITDATEIVTGAKSEGIQPDYGFNQHSGGGRQLYYTNYGKEYTNGVLNFMSLTKDTYFQLSPEKVKIVEDLFLHGVSWSAYRNYFDQHQYGRFPGASYYTIVTDQISKLISFNTPQKLQLQILKAWMTRTSSNNATNIQVGNKMFWRFDYMVHKGLNYFVSTKMISTRTVGCETGNNEGIDNYYTGSGVNYLYVAGNEQKEILTDQNWRRLPGITSPQWSTTKILPLIDWGENAANQNSFAGGVSDGKIGASGFIYQKGRSGETDLKAYKSYFYFNGYYVALGTGISSGTTYNITAPYATTVNQMKFKGSMIVDTSDSTTTITDTTTIKPASANWAYINGNGYQFINKTNLNFEVKLLGATKIAWIGYNHGVKPVNKEYAYAIYPNIAQQDFINKISATPFEIISNTINQQAVADIPNKTVQIIFYKAGKLNLNSEFGTCEVDKPAIVQLRREADSVFVSAANPYCETTPITTLKIKLSGAYSCNTNTAVVNSDTTILTLSMPLSEFQGKTETTVLKQIESTGFSTARPTRLLTIIPNQVKSGENLSVILPEKTELLSIYTLDGVLVRNMKFVKNGETNLSISTSGFSPGIYMLKTKGSVGRFIVK